MTVKILLLAAFTTLSLVLTVTPLSADEIKLKSGQTISGRVTYEAADIVKIEVAISASIKETKIIARGDIETLTKDAPDLVEFNKLQKLVPVPSLLNAENYRQILETGPDAFLKAYPGSPHTSKVQEIRDTLAKELDQVERGYLKLEGEWVSPQEKVDLKELIDSRIRLIRMENYSKTPNINSLILAMRDFEFIEENYYGSPAFPKAVELAKEVIPSLGRQLQTLSASAEYQNTEYQKALAASAPEVREQLIAARAREDKSFTDSVAADKKAGVKWVQLNTRNKQAIDEVLKLAASELPRVREFNTALLTTQAEQLVAVDKLIAEDNIAEAKIKLAEAAAITGQKTDSKSKSSSKGKGTTKSGSYIAVLNAKINVRIAEEKEKAKAKEAASDSEALTANLKKAETAPGEGETAVVEGEKPEPGSEPTEGKEAAPAAEVDEFAALAAAKKTPAKEEEKSSKTKAKSKSKSDVSSEDEDEDDLTAKKPRPVAVVADEGGFPLGLIVPIITVLLIVVVVLMKVFGVGSKKSEG